MHKTSHPGLKRLIRDIKAKCKDNDIALKLIDEPYIIFDVEGEVKISGCFDSGEMALTVATKKPEMEWIEIFAHESCHLDQFVEDSKLWKATEVNGVDANIILDLWLKHIIELNPEQLDRIIKLIIDLERDCDLRVIEKIKSYKLEDIIDINTYYRKSNAYHLSYHIVRKLRIWNKPMCAPYMIKDMYMLFPDTMLDTYTIPSKLVDIVSKRCYL